LIISSSAQECGAEVQLIEQQVLEPATQATLVEVEEI